MSGLSSLCMGLLLASVAITAVFSLPRFSRRNQSAKEPGELYFDEDGTTTEDFQVAFDLQTRLYIFVLLLCSVFGLVVNSCAIIWIREDLVGRSEQAQLLLVFLKASAALLLAFQSVTLTLTPSPIERQGQCTTTGACSILVYGANIGYDLQQSSPSKLSTPFLVIHGVLLLISTLTCFTISRRPRVFHAGNPEQPVDNERTVSLLSRYTLSWANPLLSYAQHKGGLDFQDLSLLKTQLTTESLVSLFSRFHSNRLWKHIVWAHSPAFTIQWILTLACSLATFAPQYFLFRLIEILEEDSRQPDPVAALWLALLGLTQLLQPWIETWVLWIGWCHIALPIYVQLSGLVVEKSIGKKDVKGVDASDNKPEHDDFENFGGLKAKIVDEDGSTGEKEDTPKRMQDQINLITVDAQRLSDFLSYNSQIESVLIGLASVSFLVPLNIYASRRYSKAQDGLMSARDLKTATLTEGFQGIRQIKFDALEPKWSKRIRTVRNTELSGQWKAYLAETLLMMCWIAGSYMFAAVTLSSISAYEGSLAPSVAFTALAIFQRLEQTLSLVPGFVTDFFDSSISVVRLENFLNSIDRSDDTIDSNDVVFRNASIAWPSDDQIPGKATLLDLNLKFPSYALSVVAGVTGVGKSLLLSAIIGEADVLLGTVRRPKVPLDLRIPNQSPGDGWIVPKSMAFVAQTPWIENSSIRDNILFDIPLSESRYMLVLRACALLQDIQTMDDGDMTEVGAHGISLSGGQRSRLTLARALYSRAETLVIDDVFSAVDAHVGRHILDHALTGELAKHRTIILATHHVQLCLPKASFVVTLSDGKVEHAGPPTRMPDNSRQTSSQGGNNTDESSIVAQKVSQVVGGAHQHSEAPVNMPQDTSEEFGSPTKVDHRQFFHLMTNTGSSRPNWEPKKLVQEEGREKGRIRFSVYKKYLTAASTWPWTYWLVVISLLVGFEAALIGRNWWVKLWSEETSYAIIKTKHILVSPHVLSKNNLYDLQSTIGASSDQLAESGYSRNTYYTIGMVLISLLVSFLGTFKFFWVYLGGLTASLRLSDKMTKALLHAPLRWIDTVPTGRILNRFIADFSVIDSRLADDLVLLIHSSLQLLGIVLAGALVSPFLLLISFPLLLICIYYARLYLAGARDVKRLQSVKNSPVLSQLESILSGLATLRACGKAGDYKRNMFARIDDHARCTWHLWLFNRWLGIRFAFLGSVFTLLVASFAVYNPKVGASLAGLALTFSLEFTQAVFWILRRYADVEMDMNSLERIGEYCDIPVEGGDGLDPSASWPTEGKVEIEGLSVAYAPDLPAVLKDISFVCEGGSRVGIVGRTGAGKSSLTLAMFRFLEASEGKVLIDGVDIGSLKLKTLRERMAIIPQHPVLWLGTVRSNLDQFGTYEDSELMDVLERVQLSPPSVGSSGGGGGGRGGDEATRRTSFTLSTPIAEGGLNISLGQRQLVCLARALLTRPKILIMDEATSAVDMETDRVVQESIRSELGIDCTLIVIAHKLSTVVDLDRIVVLEQGEVVEVGSPTELWEREGAFTGMVKESGERGLVEKLG